ncbi:hypothetical protein BvCmsOUNP037_01905 [Escherichia coli]|nr:hypothetical protein BvCmsOUNP037_01905 [Escherichia coli]
MSIKQAAYYTGTIHQTKVFESRFHRAIRFDIAKRILAAQVFNSKPRSQQFNKTGQITIIKHIPLSFITYKLGQSCSNKAGLPNNLIDLRTGGFPCCKSG